MFEVRVHGRRGQGVLAAAEVLAIAASLGGRHARACPGFGARRAEGEVVAYCRLDDAAGTREQVPRPDALIVADEALLDRPAVFSGLREDGYLLVNSGRCTRTLALPPLALRPDRVITVPATELARKVTGGTGVASVLLGGFVALTGVVSLDALLTALRQWYRGPQGKANAAVALTTFGIVRTEVEELTEAVP